MYCIKCQCVPVSIDLQRHRYEISSCHCVTGVTGKWEGKIYVMVAGCHRKEIWEMLAYMEGLCICVCNPSRFVIGFAYLLSEDVVRHVAGR